MFDFVHTLRSDHIRAQINVEETTLTKILNLFVSCKLIKPDERERNRSEFRKKFWWKLFFILSVWPILLQRPPPRVKKPLNALNQEGQQKTSMVMLEKNWVSSTNFITLAKKSQVKMKVYLFLFQEKEMH
jgi:hypothetical protein